MFSREFWEICKNTFFIENFRWLLLSIRLWTTEIAFTITIRWQHSISLLRDPSIVLNRQHKWVINLIFPLIRISPHCFSCSEVYFTTIIFYYVGETPPEVQWRKRKTKLSRTWRGKFFSSIWVLGKFFYFVFEKTSDSLPMWLCGLRLGLLKVLLLLYYPDWLDKI